ncbi:hypothetical protein [Phytoactinopolyspora halophila]|nr:hypothetical protein [Phytoactinopolyspora halophila]
MATFNDPKTDAAEAAHALRGLAHASRTLTDPDASYDILGALAAGLRSLQQSLEQLAAWHERHAGHAATDDGDRIAGHRNAQAAAAHLRDAASFVGFACGEVDHAHNRNSGIAWDRTASASRSRHVSSATPAATANPLNPAERDGMER